MKPNRIPLALATSLSIVLMTGCATAPEPAPAPAPAPATIAETAARTPQLSTLNKLIQDAGLAETLRSSGPFTVFAPSDEAFKAVPAATLANLAADKALLKSVLTYHVVPGRLMATDARTGNVKTVQGADVAVGKAGTFVTVDDAVVVASDVAATNGVVHIIDKVLMPPKR